MKVLFSKKRSSYRCHGLGFGTNVKKKLKRDIWEWEKVSLWVSVYDDNTCIVFIEKNITVTQFIWWDLDRSTCVAPMVISRSFILLVGSWLLNMRCSNRWYLGCSFCRRDLGRSFWSVCDKPLNIINMVFTKVVWSITSIRNLSATLNPKPRLHQCDCILWWRHHNN